MSPDEYRARRAAGEYPEHEKLRAVQSRTQAVGEFLDWVEGAHGAMLASYPEDGHTLYPVMRPRLSLLAEWVGVDQDRLEDEKRAILDLQRALNERTAS